MVDSAYSQNALNVILPSAAATELKDSGTVTPRRYEDVALLFCDIVGFTQYCDQHDPEDVVSGLQALVERFEALTAQHDLEKIKTIGDEYMATAGLLRANQAPLLSAVRCGLDMIVATEQQQTGWQVRVGVHHGPVIAGIVGHEKYQFDVWGDSVNVASRMASAGNPGTVTMTYDSWLLVEDQCEGRSLGRIDVKGKGGIELVECTGVRA